jgi:hypothetical protein
MAQACPGIISPIHEGWCRMAKQPGIDGSNRGLILSLLTDYALLLHPEQKALLKHNLPALTVWSLRDHICFDAIIIFIQKIIGNRLINPIY